MISSFFFSFQLSKICDCQSTQNESESSLPITLQSFGSFGLDIMIDSGLCYGYCLLSLFIIILLTVVFHQGVRAFGLPSLFHNFVNIAAIALFYFGSHYNRLQTTSSTDFLFSDSRFIALVFLSAVLFVMIQWTFYRARRELLSSKETTANNKNKFKDFDEIMDSELGRMETLYFQLCFFRYFMVALYCSSTFLLGHQS